MQSSPTPTREQVIGLNIIQNTATYGQILQRKEQMMCLKTKKNGAESRISLNAITPNEAEELLKKAEKIEQESNQIVAFTREIKKNSMEFRLKIIEILWKIVYSDGTSDTYESNLIRRVCGLLYISDRDSGMIKLKIKNSLK